MSCACSVMGKCSILTFLRRNPIQRPPVPVLAFMLQRLFMALDYLHTECKIIHAGKYSDFYLTLLQLLTRDFYHISRPITSCSASPIIRFLAACGGASKPLSEKETRWKNNLCVPRTQNAQKMKAPLSYATLALPFSVAKTTWKYIQPNIYRPPEVILKAPWTYSVDIWNVGCMVR